jgi:hypothetical protein
MRHCERSEATPVIARLQAEAISISPPRYTHPPLTAAKLRRSLRGWAQRDGLLGICLCMQYAKSKNELLFKLRLNACRTRTWVMEYLVLTRGIEYATPMDHLWLDV